MTFRATLEGVIISLLARLEEAVESSLLMKRLLYPRPFPVPREGVRVTVFSGILRARVVDLEAEEVIDAVTPPPLVALVELEYVEEEALVAVPEVAKSRA